MVSIPKRVSEVLWPIHDRFSACIKLVSIPKRVSEVLWRNYANVWEKNGMFQSLKGFQRFCGRNQWHGLENRTSFNP